MRCLTHGWIDGPEANPQKPGSAGTAQRSSDPTLATEDTSVLYEGEGMAGGIGYPSAEETVARWAGQNGCDPTPEPSAPAVDFSPDVDGPETAITRYAAGCEGQSGAELWAMVGERHVPGLNESFSPAVVDFLFDHAKP